MKIAIAPIAETALEAAPMPTLAPLLARLLNEPVGTRLLVSDLPWSHRFATEERLQNELRSLGVETEVQPADELRTHLNWYVTRKS